ncbi:unnamed protein product [Lampetra planeri]
MVVVMVVSLLLLMMLVVIGRDWRRSEIRRCCTLLAYPLVRPHLCSLSLHPRALTGGLSKCHAGYMGMRCESVILPVTKEETNLHTRTIALAALVISCLALIVCAVTSILFRRSKRRRDMDLESLTGKYRDGRN